MANDMTPANFQEQLDRTLLEFETYLHTQGIDGLSRTEARTAITHLIIESLPEKEVETTENGYAHWHRIKGKNEIIDTITAVIEGKQTDA